MNLNGYLEENNREKKKKPCSLGQHGYQPHGRQAALWWVTLGFLLLI